MQFQRANRFSNNLDLNRFWSSLKSHPLWVTSGTIGALHIVQPYSNKVCFLGGLLGKTNERDFLSLPVES